METGKRLSILSSIEIEELYNRPIFSSEERYLFFTVTAIENNLISEFRTLQSKIYFILQLGYFKSKRTFFIFKSCDVVDDVKYIVEKHFPYSKDTDHIEITKPTRLDQQDKILSLLKYQRCSQEFKKILQGKAEKLASISVEPSYIFKELVNYLSNRKIVIPGYSFMQDLVGNALNKEDARIEKEAKSLPHWVKDSIDELLTIRNIFYELTLMKREPKSFNYKEIRKEVTKRNTIQPLFNFSLEFLPKLSISNEKIKHYASRIEQDSIYKLKRKTDEITCIYLLCFIFTRFRKINDNLILSFLYYVNKYKQLAKKTAKEQIYELKIESNSCLEKIDKALHFYVDQEIFDETVFGEIREKVFAILPKDKFSLVSKYLTKAKFDEVEYEWNYYAKFSKTIRKNLQYIFGALDFQTCTKNTPLSEAIAILKDILQKKKSLTELRNYAYIQEIIKPNNRRYFYEEKQLNIDGKEQKIVELNLEKFEFLIYLLVKNDLESHDIFVKESVQFRSIEDYLVNDKIWENKERLIQELNFPYLSKGVDNILAYLSEELETRLRKVNHRIKQKKNKGIKIITVGEKTKWRLPYKKINQLGDHSFYDYLPKIELVDLLLFVNDKTDFIACFTHFLERYTKVDMDLNAVIAAFTSFATNNGINKMASMCNIPHRTLLASSNNFIRLKTLKEANDKISNKIAELPIYPYYNIDGLVHASSDGQKFETKISTINSRYSPKYFGLKQGIVNYTLIANHVPINAKIIGANEHESHFVFDVLFNNTSDIQPSAVSVDMHGRNNINASILHVFGYRFAVRYSELNQDSKVIFGFKNPADYKNYVIKPIRKINDRLIKDEWDNMERTFVSLALKETTQSIIVKKLSSTKRKNKTKRALWEFDNIISSIYALDYIDDILLRQRVQKSINREDTYHQLCRAIFYANHGKFWVKTELEQNIWSQCTRLVANCIIFYNAYILSNLMVEKEQKGLIEEANFLRRISPMAWRHINLYGRYEFKDKGNRNISEIIDTLKSQALDFTEE